MNVFTHLTGTEAQEAQRILEKTNRHTPALLSAGHCDHKKLGLVFLEGKDTTFQNHGEAHTGSVCHSFVNDRVLF